MKRQLERIEDSSCGDDSSASSQDEATYTNTPSTTKQTTIRNNRSRRYVDNIVQQAPPNTTSSLNSTATTTNRNSTSQQHAFEQNSALSFPFVSSSTKVPTNRRHLKLRKQLKTCSNFSSSYFVLDVNAPAANTIGFMGSTRGNDIPVLLTDTVSNNNQTPPVTNNSSTQPPSKKKTKRAQQNNSNNNSNNSTVTFVSSSNKKGGNKKWTTSLVNTNTTITNSLNNNNNTTTTTTTNSTNPQPTTSTTQQSFQQFVNPMSSQTMINLPNMGDFQSVLPHTNPQIVSPMNSFQQDFTIQSLLQPSPKNGYQNVQNIPQQNNTFQPSFESMMNCYNNPVMNSPPLGQYSNNSSIDASPPLTSPSTPSTQSNGINSPIIGSLINANLVYQSNSMTSGSFGMPPQNLLNYNSSSGMVNQNNQQQTVCLEDLLSHEDARMLFSLICSQYKNQFQ